ncbi:MAG: bifunctional riboflavin kinase/FAD synthetase [Clostridia bacterium]|nr:bifunctional riboflavin kinase/FAD synthetase [Clostridia bacterium]
MLTHNTITYVSPCPCVLALGCFDGVHSGHREVISTAKAIAADAGLPLTVFTFEQPPRNFFAPASVPIITPPAEKARIFETLGVDNAIIIPHSAEIFSMSAEGFIDNIIIGRLRAAHIVCGFNYTFGAKGLGSTDLLTDRCKSNGIDVTVIPEYRMGGQSVSSSAIREAVAAGDMKTAAILLGRPYSLTSVVVDGQHLARRLGFPTVNTIPESGILLPKNGVYASRIRFDGEERFGITNVGIRPTVDTNILCAETHIFDFDGDLYGKRITVEFIEFIREETRFPDVDVMADQVKNDIITARGIFGI